MKNGQSAIEFAMMIGMVLVLFIVLFAFLSSNILELTERQDFSELNVVSNKLYDEIILAYASEQAYSRIVDTSIYFGNDINVEIVNDYVLVVSSTDTDSGEFVNFLPDSRLAYGQFCKGENEIYKDYDRVVHICCGRCDKDFSERVECLGDIWGVCNETITVGAEFPFRAGCNLTYDYASIQVNDTPSSTVYQDNFTEILHFENNQLVWFGGGANWTFPSSTDNYNVSLYCGVNLIGAATTSGPFACDARNSIGLGAGLFYNGTGTVAQPYGICNCTMLQDLAQTPVLGANATLLSDIDCSDTITWNSGSGFEPIGTCTGSCASGIEDPYVGRFFGQGYEITGLYQNWPAQEGVGLFGNGYESATLAMRIYDTTINNDVTGSNSIGGLIGYARNVTISNSHFSGFVSSLSSGIGGLVGSADYVTISDSSSSATVSGGAGSGNIGGLVGSGGYSTISNSMSSGSVGGNSYLGGLIGSGGSSTVINSSSSVNVTGTYDLGGLIGEGPFSTISNSTSSGNITGTDDLGGLVGFGPYSNISNSSFSGVITGTNNLGGLIGNGEASNISNSFSSGTVNGTYRLGGLLASGRDATVSNSYFSGFVTGTYDLGGLVGYGRKANISNSFTSGSINGTNYVGGLVGTQAYGNLSNSFSNATVRGGISVGGLIGRTTGFSYIDSSFFTGNVTGTSAVGGVGGSVGYGPVINSYSTGSVNGSHTVGGFIGQGGPAISNGSSSGTVNCSDAGTGYCGGFIGYSFTTVIYLSSNWTNYTTDTATGCIGQAGTLTGTDFTPAENCTTVTP